MAFTNTAYGLDTQRDEDWRTKAACRQHDPDDWFPVNGDSHFARRICTNECPFVTRERCWNWAVGHGQLHGVWGGRTEIELRRAVKQLGSRMDEGGECPHGHVMDEANTYSGSKGELRCRTCRRDSWQAVPTRTRCVNNHPYDSENTYFSPDGKRVCRTCHRDSQARARARELPPADVFAASLAGGGSHADS